MQNTDDSGLAHLQANGHADSVGVAHLPLMVERLQQATVDGSVVGVKRDRLIPLSYAQERLWFLDQLGLVGAAYNMPMAWRLKGNLNVEALERSFVELVHRHETLRTRFGVEHGVPHQLIDQAERFQLHRTDLSDVVNPVERERQLRECVQREQLHRFDLCEGPLLRAVLVKLGDREHALLLTIHHIVSDGWSLGVLRREIGALYGMYSQKLPSPLPGLTVQYVHYVGWQRKWAQGDALQEQLQYWKKRLAGVPAQIDLPTDRRRPAMESFRGAELKFELSAVLSRTLKDLARREGATLFMLSLAVYQILLSRWSAQQDIVVGSPIAGRSHQELEGLIGLFLNMLVLRTDLSGNPTFRQLLKRVTETTLEAYVHQDVPFEVLVKELRPERNLGRQSIFQVALVLQNYPEEPLQLSGLASSLISAERVTTHFDLTLYLYGAGERIFAKFEYATDLFDERTIEQMAGHFRRLLEAIAADPDCPVQQLPMLTAAECQQVLYEFNDTAAAYPEDRLIHELFEEWVRRSPDAVAVVYEAQVLTYAELNTKANQLAHYLREQGMQIGEYVPILMSRCPNLLIAQLAVLKCGGVYVPMDPSLPSERQAFMTQDCAARLILTDCRVRVGFEGKSILWIDPLEVADALNGPPQGDLQVQMSARSPAYVMYTSGSTGLPKGVIVPHRAVNRLAINNGYARIEPADRIAHCSNPAFDASTFEIWGALLNGASVLIVPSAVVLQGERLAEALSKHRVTVLWMTVGLFAQYAEVLATALGELRYVITGGDVVERSMIRRLPRSCRPEHLLNAYGPTECTTFSTTYLIEEVDEDTGSIPIGRPISNAQIYILDHHLKPVPVGVVGELYIGGAGVALGYLNRPELTAERFIADPFSRDPQAHMYKSGDLARWHADGNIEFVGRNDQQVKLRGFRVELGEIEAQLLLHCQVKEAAVVARAGVPGGKRLVAYVTVHDGCLPTIDQLRAHLSAVLPDYMMPSAFVILDSLPLTLNGKLDRRALPAPEIEAYARREYQPPQGEVEQVLARIWRQLLQVERIGRHDNFFELGGHSLLVLEALFKMNQSLCCALSVSDVYRSPTLRELAIRIRGDAIQDDLVDLSREAVLDDEIVATPRLHSAPVEAVMLTGATGFVGRFLLTQLLQDTDATIYCVTRASSQRQALSRLRMTLAKWDLWCDEFENRIVAVPGDLRLSRLGLDDDTYQALSRNVDSIYHCATSMNHLETYSMAKPANVASARELLRFATNLKSKLINYISTLSVFSSGGIGRTGAIDETSPIDREEHSFSAGYAASKWVAEKIFLSASEKGIPCNIFRLGLVWADAQQGRYDELQREYRILKSCLLSGCGIKNYRYGMAPIPVDYVARAVVFLASRYRDGQGIFHISSADRSIDDVFERCNDVADASLELKPYYDWICAIKQLHHDGWSLPVVPLVEYAFSMDEASFQQHQHRIRSARLRIACDLTHRELEHAGIVAPAFNDDLLRVCVESMVLRDAELRREAVASIGNRDRNFSLRSGEARVIHGGHRE